MKKTMFFVLVCALSSAVLFAIPGPVGERFETPSGGVFSGWIRYVGQNCGQRIADTTASELKKEFRDVFTNAKLQKGYAEAINTLLNRYETSKGDTFQLYCSELYSGVWYYCVCEFTSDTQYTWWIFLCDGLRLFSKADKEPACMGGIAQTAGKPAKGVSMGNIDWDKLISENWGHIPNIREQFAKIQENPALYGAENGFTAQSLEELEKLLAITGEVNLAGNEITNRYLAGEIDEERRQRHAKTNRTDGTTQTRGKDREEF